jgi:hypothetical protein
MSAPHGTAPFVYQDPDHTYFLDITIAWQRTHDPRSCIYMVSGGATLQQTLMLRTGKVALKLSPLAEHSPMFVSNSILLQVVSLLTMPHIMISGATTSRVVSGLGWVRLSSSKLRPVCAQNRTVSDHGFIFFWFRCSAVSLLQPQRVMRPALCLCILLDKVWPTLSEKPTELECGSQQCGSIAVDRSGREESSLFDELDL